MGTSDILWLLFVIAALQPWLTQRLLILARQRKISQLQTKRNTQVITLVHRQETMRLLGFPLMRYIDLDDSEAVIRAIHMAGNDRPLDIILHTPGGQVTAALQIARALRAHPAAVTVFVPHIAMSGGTLIALAADRIVMFPHSMLGPIDPQVDGFPAPSLARVMHDKPIAEIDDRTVILADVAEKATAQVRKAAAELLSRSLTADRAAAIAEALTSGRWTHDHPITALDAEGLGLPISQEMPEEVLELMALYPQPSRVVPSVEYFPRPPVRPADPR